jgi:TPR repeat protein
MSSSSSSISSSPPVTLICSVCGEKSALRCSNCLGAFYCSIPCQKKDWKTHKVTCKKAQEVKKSIEALGCHTVEEIDAKLEENRGYAELGDANAQYNMGLSYSNGLGVSVDKVEAVKWYRMAALRGQEYAQYSLGFMYQLG